MTMEHHINPQYVICIKNDEYPASLEPKKIYQSIPDPQASEHGYVRIIVEYVTSIISD
jgi:hypothetical protein